MPAEVHLAKRANPLERSVRQKVDSQAEVLNTVSGDKEDDQHEQGKEEDVDWGSDTQLLDPAVFDSLEKFPASLDWNDLTAAEASERHSTAAEAPGKELDSDPTTIPATTTVEAQPKTGVEAEGGKFYDNEEEIVLESDGEESDEAEISKEDEKSSSSSNRDLVRWSDLLMVDVVLGYFRYFAHKRKDYIGRTFNHRTQVRSCIFVPYGGIDEHRWVPNVGKVDYCHDMSPFKYVAPRVHNLGEQVKLSIAVVKVDVITALLILSAPTHSQKINT